MIALDDLPRLRRQAAEIRRRRDEAVGREKQIAARMKSMFNIKTPEEGDELVQKELDKLHRISTRYTKEYKRVKRKYRKELDNDKRF